MSDNFSEWQSEVDPSLVGTPKDELLALPTSAINLSIRADNFCNNRDVKTLGELIARSREEYLKYAGFGARTMNEIEAKLAVVGLALKADLKPDLPNH